MSTKIFLIFLLLAIATGEISAQCGNISFVANNNTTQCSPAIVYLSTNGAPIGSEFYWDFGNGFNRGSDTAIKTFVIPGNYSVSLIVKLPNGTYCDTIAKSNFINVLPSPKPKIHIVTLLTPQQVLCNGPVPVTFFDSTANSFSREWIIDGVHYQNANKQVTHAFSGSGNKSVTLKVKNSQGCEGIYSKSDYIKIFDSLDVDFCANTNQASGVINAGYTPFLSPPANNAVYNWIFQGGTPSSSNQRIPPAINYGNVGNDSFKTTLTVTTNAGCVYSRTRNNFIKKFLTAVSDTICLSTIANIKNHASGEDRGYFNWKTMGASALSSSKNGVLLQYNAPGTFNVEMSYKYKENGCTNKHIAHNLITVLPPNAVFWASNPYACEAPHTLQLHNTSRSQPTTNYTWQIYDEAGNELPGSPIGPIPFKDTSFIINQTGIFSVRLTASDVNGCSHNMLRENYIKINTPVADFEADTSINCVDGEFLLLNETSPPELQAGNYIYKWHIWHADSPNISHRYSFKDVPFSSRTPGKYHVELIVLNNQANQNCGDTIVKYNHLTIKGIQAEMKLDKDTICTGDTITAFANILLDLPNKPNHNYYWEIAPNLSTNKIIPVNSPDSIKISFNKNGCYNLRLTINSTDGCELNYARRICVGTMPEFIIDTPICAGQPVQLHNFTTRSTGFQWETIPTTATFSSANAHEPTVTFNSDTTYKVLLISHKQSCSDTIIERVEVSKVVADFEVEDTVYCAPKTALFTTNGAYGNIIRYEWAFGDGNILYTTNPSPVHTYLTNDPSGFSIALAVENDIGCRDSIKKNAAIHVIGPVPKFTIDTIIGCDSVEVTFVDNSTNLTSYIFDFDDGNIDSTAITSGNKIFKHKYYLGHPTADSVFFVPTLIAFDDLNCALSYKDTIIIYRSPSADFISDTTVGCAPLTVSFLSTSIRGKYWEWDFNEDGIIDDSVYNPVFEYLKSDTIDVSLKVTGDGGCKATMVKKEFIKLAPDIIPSFVMDNNTACDSLRVEFTNASQNFQFYSMDYGNGSPKDSNLLRPAYYKYDHTSMIADSVIFYPELTAYNSFGCMRKYRDTITIYPTPKPFINADVDIGCDPLAVQFTGPQQFVAEWEWDFNQDNTIDDTDQNPTASFHQGVHTIYLYVKGLNGCNADITVPKMINVYTSPQAAFHTSDTLLCPGDTINFKDFSYSPYRIQTFDWTFTGGVTEKNFTRYPDPVQYNDPGDYEVSLAVTDEHGCSDTIVKPAHIHVKTNLPPPTSNPLVVTVFDSTLVQVTWQTSKLPDFAEYRLFRNDNPPVEIYSTQNLLDTQFIDGTPADVFISNNCYFIRTTDKCGNVSLNSEIHCTIVLEISTFAPSQNLLEWSHYIGWQTVQEYEVYRSIAGKNFTKIGSTTSTEYLDEDLCDLEYCYYIVAISPEGLRSQSNHGCNNPPYIYQDTELKMRRTTVVDDSYTLTEWKPGIQTNTQEYTLSKLHPVYGWQEKFTSTTNLHYLDFDVNVDSHSYQYKVQVKDDCENLSPLSDIATSIKLTAEIANDNVLLNWNHYRNWPQNVLHYIVEYAPAGGNFSRIAILPGTDSTYVDEKIHENNDSFYCYRITAIENAFTETDTSVSNITCTALPSRLFVPNAFTPNGDGDNDVFKVSVLSMFNIPSSDLAYFRFAIYDRWGNQIFETTDYHQGWDGTFRNVPSPEGVYIFLVRARGYDGKDYDINGNVTLFR